MVTGLVDELDKIGSIMRAPKVTSLVPKLPAPGKAPSLAQIKSKVMKPSKMGGMSTNYTKVNAQPPTSPQKSMIGGVIDPKGAPAPGISYGSK